MKETSIRALWGLLFIFFGIGLAGRVFGYDILFPGWWTFFIIIPSLVGIVKGKDGERTVSYIGFGIGAFLLFICQGLFSWGIFWRLVTPSILVAIGIRIIFKGQQSNSWDSRKTTENYSSYKDTNSEYYTNTSANHKYEEQDNNDTNSNNADNRNWNDTNQKDTYKKGTSHGEHNRYNGILGSRNIQYVEEEFSGAVINSILGNVQLDLRNAYFKHDTAIEVTCILGGIDIYVPFKVKVAVNCTTVLGGVDNVVITPVDMDNETYTIFVNGSCILGGIEVK